MCEFLCILVEQTQKDALADDEFIPDGSTGIFLNGLANGDKTGYLNQQNQHDKQGDDAVFQTIPAHLLSSLSDFVCDFVLLMQHEYH